MARIDINVPYAEKDEAKMLGARWDPANKTWYVPDGVSIDHFLKWLSDCNVIAPHWYIAQAYDYCWKCGCGTVMTSVLLPEGYQTIEQDDDGIIYWKKHEIPAFIFYIYDIPVHIMKNFECVTHYLSKDYSKTVDAKYWMNHCQHCHMKQGDFQLHCEVDGAFTPANREQASGIYLTRIEQSFSASCGGISHEHLHYRFGSGEMFLTSGEWFPYMDKI
ncbi:DNA primase [Salmonella enterica]|uniref:DNA primase n=1 Tax=Salmonella enterica subsp. enterica serovar Java TaxID=224729 RepID=A0A3Z6QT41_SALEB|nr:DNA primase [Salmonella enterica subsp. enterica serovar Java]EAO0165844.1 DNA primase [Salmonella enterica]ECD9517193.1 DNA primase [Salmonella enterica subsp. diarizonae]EDQ0182502.1 DNA primase [Salmonella enterica subsp. enterica serovar 4,[5],12:b:-]EEE5612816.1 DNA primase [Salmonella enterica subsp. enterica serovar Typhimurium]EGL0768389.1 DNA primase [Salmonella enterica subsp. enterica]HCM8912659.1 DNA primase [Salmonella enterica subsp. enterica serovar Paratyphi B]